jgi:hypothetical protein
MLPPYPAREFFLTFFSAFEQGGVCWMVDRRNRKKKRSSCEHLQRHLGTRLLNSALSTLLQCLHTSKAAVPADNLRLCHWEALWVDYYYIVWVVSTQYYWPIACPTQLASTHWAPRHWPNRVSKETELSKYDQVHWLLRDFHTFGPTVCLQPDSVVEWQIDCHPGPPLN